MATATVTPGGSSANFHGGPRVAYNVITELWDRTSAELDRAELEWFAGASDEAETALSNLQVVVEGVACLVQADNDPARQIRCSNFKDASSLLFAIEHSLGSIRGLLRVANDASARLSYPDSFFRSAKKVGAA